MLFLLVLYPTDQEFKEYDKNSSNGSSNRINLSSP